MKPMCFYFSFSLTNPDDEDDDNIEDMRGFTVVPPSVLTQQMTELYDEFYPYLDDGKFTEKTEELEMTYGVHDWSSGPVDDVIGIGYSTYEVEVENIDNLMNEWREFFVSIFGNDAVSEVVVVQNTMGNDKDIFDQIQACTRKDPVSI